MIDLPPTPSAALSGDAPRETTPGLSVVIPVLDAATTIGQQLTAVLAQRDGLALEIVVVDNGSTDGTVDVVRRMQERSPEVVLIDGSDLPRGGAAAKNAGVRAATHRMIAFCDADDLVRDGWLAAMRAALAAHPVVTCDREYSTLNPHLRRLYRPPTDRRALYDVFGVPGVSGGAFGMDRDLYLELGGFDEGFRGAVDSEFSVRLAKAGLSPVHESTAVVSVRLTTSSRDAFRRARILLRSSFEIARRHDLHATLTPASVAGSIIRLARPIRVWQTDARFVWMTNAGKSVGRLEAFARRRKRT